MSGTISNPHKGRPLTPHGFSSDRVRAWSRRPETRHVVLLWIALTVALIFFAFVPARIMGPPASPTKRAVEDTMTVFSLAAAPVAALVWAVAIYSLIKWRRKGATGPSDEDGPPMRGSRSPATVVWLIVSSLLCVFMLIWGLAEIQKVNASASSPDPFVVDVTGQQWVWTFRYPQDGNIESDQLYLPVNRSVEFYVRSEDVIHSFWVVQLGIKIDANPGVTTKTSVFPDRIGTYDVRCAELCGLLHADMETSAHVVSASDLDHWVTANGGQVS
jgi:cytochrome c oxidase subunit 2